MEEKIEKKEPNSKMKIVIAYLISLLGIIFLNTEKNMDEQTKNHYKQSSTIFLFLLGNSILVGGIFSGFIPFAGNISYFISVALFIVSLIAAVKAYNDEFYEIPVIFDLSKKIFKK